MLAYRQLSQGIRRCEFKFLTNRPFIENRNLLQVGWYGGDCGLVNISFHILSHWMCLLLPNGEVRYRSLRECSRSAFYHFSSITIENSIISRETVHFRMNKTRQRLGTDYPRQERSNNAGIRNLAQVCSVSEYSENIIFFFQSSASVWIMRGEEWPKSIYFILSIVFMIKESCQKIVISNFNIAQAYKCFEILWQNT